MTEYLNRVWKHLGGSPQKDWGQRKHFLENVRWKILKTLLKVKHILTNMLGPQGHKVKWDVSPAFKSSQYTMINI